MSGGRGPAPRHQRRRRNEPARGDWVELLPLDRPVLGPLPDGAWSPSAVTAWEAWRKDPVTAMWSPADVAYALDAIRLLDSMTARSANEVRLRMDGLGLTPKGKRDLRWRVVEDGPPAEVRHIDEGHVEAARKARLSKRGDR